MLTLANAASTIITTRGGALRVMPEEEESLKQIEKSTIRVMKYGVH